MTTTGLVDVARLTPFWALHTGADAVPAFASLHVALPLVPTYTVSASVAQCPSARHTPGPPPLAAHWASLVQAWQVNVVVVSQIGEVPEQSPLSAQPTH